MDLDHIWDLPIEHPPATTPGPANQPLFLPSDDEGDVAPTTRPSANKDPDIDALFDGIDDLNELAPALDLDALRREADARNTRLVRAEISASIPTIQLSTTTTTAKSSGPLDGIDGGDENGDGKKKRKPIAKLDEARLLGKNGLPQLIKDTKNFKPKGKGHEVTYFPPLPTLLRLISRDASGNRSGPRAPGVPILDPQTVSEDQIQGDGRPGREALPLKAHAGAPLNPYLYNRVSSVVLIGGTKRMARRS
jgi:hypothetical protein